VLLLLLGCLELLEVCCQACTAVLDNGSRPCAVVWYEVSNCLPTSPPCRAAPPGGGERDAAVAVHPGLVNTALAAGYFKQMPPKLLRPLTDPFFTHVFCPYMLRRLVPRWPVPLAMPVCVEATFRVVGSLGVC